MKKMSKNIFVILFISPLIVAIVMFGFSQPALESPDRKRIKFMTYNIHFGHGMDDELNLERIAQNIKREDPDIIGLQEVENGRITTQGVDMGYWLAKRLNMYYYVYYSPVENEHYLGVGLLSKYPIKSSQGYDIPSISLQRIIIHCVVEINSDLELDIFIVHVGLSDEDTEKQIDFILETIENKADSSNPHILMGDFNLEDDTDEIEEILDEFDDTYEEYNAKRDDTFPSYDLYGVKDESIDYIFARDYDDIIDSYLVDDMIEEIDSSVEYGSDHIPVVTILEF